MKTQTLSSAGLVAALLLANLPAANAIPTVTISAGPTTVQDVGIGGGDASPAGDGIVNTGTLTVGIWTFNAVGTTKPAIGSTSNPKMDLNFGATSTGPGTLTITFTEIGFTYLGSLLDIINGNSDHNTTLVRDNLLVNGQIVASTGDLQANPGFTGQVQQSVNLGANDVLGLQVVIQHRTEGTTTITTGDKLVVTAPEGGTTAMLLGVALSGLGLLRKKLA